jgi:hypothetical protein
VNGNDVEESVLRLINDGAEHEVEVIFFTNNQSTTDKNTRYEQNIA